MALPYLAPFHPVHLAVTRPPAPRPGLLVASWIGSARRRRFPSLSVPRRGDTDATDLQTRRAACPDRRTGRSCASSLPPGLLFELIDAL
jgi:hypothetical protein